MNSEQNHGRGGSGVGPALGFDVGATLTKLAIFPPGEQGRFEVLGKLQDSELSGLISSLGPSSIGVTGGGAERLFGDIHQSATLTLVDEFTAWGAGASALLAQDPTPHPAPYLLVSVGTGTSALRVDGDSVHRVGGTALGGGTVLGLGSLLCDCLDFGELCRMAERGKRQTVDLMLSDVYPSGDNPLLLAADITASSFARISHPTATGPKPSHDDLAAAIMGLVGENVALICASLARAAGATHVFYGGSTLRGNTRLADLLITLTTALGRPAHLLPNGEFAGAIGASQIAQTHA